MTPWATGRADVDDLVERGHLEKVAPSTANADRLIGEANRHLRSAELLSEEDPAGAYDLLYAAARKSMAAALAVQGLRATSAGGHVAVERPLQPSSVGQETWSGLSGLFGLEWGSWDEPSSDEEHPEPVVSAVPEASGHPAV